MSTGSKRLAVALAAAALTVAACGGGAPTAKKQGGGGGDSKAQAVFDKLNGLPADQARKEAVKLAKQEGEFSLYTSFDSDVADQVKATFAKQFGIKVNMFRGNSETVLQRVEQESSANRLGADAVETNFDEMTDMSSNGMFADYKGAHLKDVGKTATFDHWTATRYNIMLPAWNTKLIKPGQEPKSWEDLASPRFNGKLTLEVSDSDWMAAVSLYWKSQGKSQQQIDNLWKQIADGAKVAKGHSAMMELLGAGQTAMDAMNYSYITQGEKDKGAPVTYRNASGKAGAVGFPRPNGVGMFATAKHPAAAWLFYDWLLSDGQKLLVKLHLTPSTKVPGDHSLDGVTLKTYPIAELLKNQPQWDKRYDALLRGVPKQQGG